MLWWLPTNKAIFILWAYGNMMDDVGEAEAFALASELLVEEQTEKYKQAMS